LSYQPENETTNLPGTVPTRAIAPEVRQSTYLSYNQGNWDVSLQNQWLSSVKLAATDSQIYADPRLPSYNVLDVTVSKRFELKGADSSVFLTVNNVANERAPLFPSGAGIPGLFYPTLGFYDDMGRYFTVGFRANL
jgi:iron complex outermembrane receptor protein